jgi:hypothetical protein
MKLADLDPKIIQEIKSRRFDWFVEKHEGPWLWEYFLKHCEIIEINGHQVLLPAHIENHPNIKVLRCLESSDGQTLTIFLKDTTYVTDPDREWAEAGFMAVCDKFKGQDFFIATHYHECYLIDEMPKRRKTNKR